MINTVQSITYKAFGFTVSSEIFLPELPTVILQNSLADIEIKRGDLIGKWNELSQSHSHFIIDKNQIMFCVPDKAVFLIRNGREIYYSPFDDLADEHFRLYLLGTCMGAILMQKKILPLHGSCVVINKHAYAIVGHSGAGKSTLASAFLQRGYQLLSDDVIPVIFSDEHIPMVVPSYPQQKLWMESLNQFGMESSHYKPLVERETKFSVPVADQFVNQPMPLGGIIELIKTEEDGIRMRSIEGMERFHTLFTHTYRNLFLEKSGLMDWHFSTSAQLVNKLSFHQLSRPVSHFTANNLVDYILSSIKKEVFKQ